MAKVIAWGLSVVLSFLLGLSVSKKPTNVAITTTTTEVVATTSVVVTEPPVIETTAPPTPTSYTMTVVATAYCPCKTCCGVYAENRPNGIVYTASGAVAKANHTIAVDTSVIPFGTTVIINGNEYVAEDTGSAINGNRVDIYFDNHEDALNWGRQTIEIEVIL
jgi:3D (Asp-Asp-Asp) domain-containing protein